MPREHRCRPPVGTPSFGKFAQLLLARFVGQSQEPAKLDHDRKVIAAERDKGKADWVACSEAEKPVPRYARVVFWANPGTPLRTVMLAMHRADTAPVALFDEGQRFVGAIGVRDVLQAVLRRSMA